MKRYSRTLRHSPITYGIKGLFLALICIAVLFGCSSGSGDNTGANAGTNAAATQPTPLAAGTLNVNVNPAPATVVVSGPNNFTHTFSGNQFLTDLEPGQYMLEATSPGFVYKRSNIDVVAGLSSNISMVLLPTPIISDAPAAVYRNGQGNLISLDSSNMQSGQFYFYAWLEDLPGGILATALTSPIVSDPGKPLLTEQTEIAPSFTQNLAGAWVGFKDSTGVVRSVIGADIRWEIDQWWSGRVNSIQFGTSDDNRSALGYGVFDDQADTRTNNASLEAERFPLIATDYPLYNRTGIGTPFTDGFTWVTLFSPDKVASGRIVAVATINGEEIGKQIIYKNFAAVPKLQITKTVNTDVVNIVAGTATATWTVTVKNVGLGDAPTVNLTDILASGAGASYSLSSLPAGSTPVGDGFTNSFPLTSGNTVTQIFTATVTAPGTYCNEGQLLAATNPSTLVDLTAQACFTALASNLSIVKDFVAANNTTSLGKTLTVAVNVPAKLRVRVINSGSGGATGVNVNDTLTSGAAGSYQLISVTPGTPNVNDGFDNAIGGLAAGATSTMLLSVSASADGVYCDTATVTATSGSIGIGSDSTCLTVATPILTITKSDAPASVLPGANYTSTIVVNNTGTATANNVVISDLLGLNPVANVLAIYVSSSLNGAGGTLANNIVTANTVDILAGGSLTFTVVSRIPLGAANGTYCDTATVTSTNAATKLASACVTVPAFSALQTQLIDSTDPIAAGSNVTYFSVMYSEALSNEGVHNNLLTYSFGLVSPTVLGIPGVFRVVSTKIYLDTNPILDPATGLVVSDTTNPTAVPLREGIDYTLNNNTAGLQVITMIPGVRLQPDTAFYAVHVVLVPGGTPTNKMYTTSYIWDSTGLLSTTTYEASSSEPTTVLP